MLYQPIGKVAKMLNVNPSLLRFWEKELPVIKPHKNAKGDRFYTEEDIQMLRYIYHLTRNCGYTLDGVRERLRRYHANNRQQQVIHTLTECRSLLVELKEML